MMGEEEEIMEMMYDIHNHNQQHSHQKNKLENWEEEVLRSMKQESDNNNGSPPNKSCVTIHNNINEDDNKNNHNGLNLSKCISSEMIGSNKKPKLQVPSLQSTDLIKTDTASVLSEAIGYIGFLHSQIEALSLPYFGTSTTNNMMHQHATQGYMNSIFPEDPGQLMNEDVMIRSSNTNEEPNKDLRSKGLCLVPISYILQVGNENGTDYWAPTFGFAFQ